MRHFLFNSLVSRLRQITDTDGNPVIKSFDIWNNNLQYLNVGQAFELPAVFIEFAPLSWSHQGKGVRDTIATVRLHVLQQATSSSLSEGGYFKFEQAKDLEKLAKRLDIDERVSYKVPIPDDYWYDTYDIPRPKYNEQAPEPKPDDEPDGKKPASKAKKRLLSQVKSFSTIC